MVSRVSTACSICFILVKDTDDESTDVAVHVLAFVHFGKEAGCHGDVIILSRYTFSLGVSSLGL